MHNFEMLDISATYALQALTSIDICKLFLNNAFNSGMKGSRTD